MTRRYAAAAAALLGVAAGLTGCSGSSSDEETLTVLAASSLTESFTTLAEEFETEHPGVTVKLAFDSSATLAQQAAEGAPADVLATADLATMQSADDAGVLAAPAVTFATNTAVLVTPPDDPAGIAAFSDLQRDSVTYVVCVDTAPCGKVAAALLAAGGIDHPPASFEPDVKAVLAKVADGEADAGIVYRTDARAAGDGVRELPIPGSDAQLTTYPIAPLEQSGDADLAAAFVELVTGTAGQQVLAEAGFGHG